MDDEDLFSQDALCRSSQCSKCSENLDRTPDDPDEYNPLCTVCRQRLGEAVAFSSANGEFKKRKASCHRTVVCEEGNRPRSVFFLSRFFSCWVS